MAQVFNLGIGMLVFMRPDAVTQARQLLPELVPLGEVVARSANGAPVLFDATLRDPS